MKAGIAFPMVKEILKSLQCDNLVDSEKIGIGVFYWAFPSKALQIVKFLLCSMRLKGRTVQSK